MPRKFLLNNIVWLIIAALLVVGIICFKIYYPGSQWQLRNEYRVTEAVPIEHFYNATEGSCGIWYESIDASGKVTAGRSNNKVMKCFEEAFGECGHKNVFIIKEQITPKQLTTFSFVKTVLRNDQGKCLIQNFYEEQTADPNRQNEIPIAYVNTCTVLSDDVLNSCEPLYIQQMKTVRGE